MGYVMRVRLASFFAGTAMASTAGLYILYHDYKFAHLSLSDQGKRAQLIRLRGRTDLVHHLEGGTGVREMYLQPSRKSEMNVTEIGSKVYRFIRLVDAVRTGEIATACKKRICEMKRLHGSLDRRVSALEKLKEDVPQQVESTE